MFAALLVLALSAGLNRARGDARWMPAWLPGRALWYAALLGVLFAALSLAAYEFAWRWQPDNPIWLAELATGALWGGLILTL